ncbi:hypothetical protein SGLAM104S_07372 [Streptomyces glaucescens]
MLSCLPKVKVSAHCDLPCGVYDPAQARIEAESVKAVQEKMAANDDPHFQARATVIKEQRADARQAPRLGALERLLQAPALREVPRSCTSWSTTP